MERTRWLAAEADHLYTRFAETVEPGQTEQDIAARFHAAHLAAGMHVDVLIVGSDERCFPVPPSHPNREKAGALPDAAHRRAALGAAL